jgi:hypothetical protein
MAGKLRTMGRAIGREQNRALRNMVTTMRVERKMKEAEAAYKEFLVLRSAQRVAFAATLGGVLLVVGFLALAVAGVL